MPPPLPHIGRAGHILAAAVETVMARGQEVLAGAGLHVDADAVDGHGPAGERIGVAGDAGLRLAQLGVRQFFAQGDVEGELVEHIGSPSAPAARAGPAPADGAGVWPVPRAWAGRAADPVRARRRWPARECVRGPPGRSRSVARPAGARIPVRWRRRCAEPPARRRPGPHSTARRRRSGGRGLERGVQAVVARRARPFLRGGGHAGLALKGGARFGAATEPAAALFLPGTGRRQVQRVTMGERHDRQAAWRAADASSWPRKAPVA